MLTIKNHKIKISQWWHYELFLLFPLVLFSLFPDNMILGVYSFVLFLCLLIALSINQFYT